MDKEAWRTVVHGPAILIPAWAGGSTSWNQDARRNINNLRYADDTTLMAESEEELKSLLMKVTRPTTVDI